MIYNNTYFLSKLVQTLSEGYNHILLKEAVPYSIVKNYLKIKRSPEAETVIKKVFSNLKSLPNATQLDKRGNRIAIPYGEQSVEQEIDSVLSKYNFSIKDFEKGIATDTKSNREIKLGKALNIVSKKEPKAKELLDLFSSAKSKGVQSQDEGLMLVFSNHPYDIAGMSTGRSWSSCMNLLSGSNKSYVSLDIEKGTIICYLAKSTDKDLKNPIGRILIKPFLNVEDDKDVILYPEEKTYGSIDNPEKFISTIDDIMEKVQNVSGAYKKMGCLYSDSRRKSIMGEEGAIKLAQRAIESKDILEDSIFKKLPEDLKNEYLNMAIGQGYRLSDLQYQDASDEQKQLYIEKRIELRFGLTDQQYQDTPGNLKQFYIKKRVKAGRELTETQYQDASDNLKQLYIEKKVEKELPLNDMFYQMTPNNVKKYYFELLKKNNIEIPKYLKYYDEYKDWLKNNP